MSVEEWKESSPASSNSESELSICNVCKDLGFQNLIWCHITAVGQARANGCYFCGLISQTVDLLREKTDRINTVKEILPTEVFQLEYNRPWQRLSIHFNIWLEPGMELFQHPGLEKPWFTCERANEVSGNTQATYPKIRVRKWLSDCVTSHTRCSSQPSTTPDINPIPHMPKRVIDVAPRKGELDVRLIESMNIRARYLCLSHCWGKHSAPLKTTKANLLAHRDRIQWHCLPKTFQDAIACVRSLGERYLWIDSLCIVQDDRVEWDEHAVQMSSIYENCYLTLAATKASDSDEGFYNKENQYSSKSLREQRLDGHEVSVLCRQKVQHYYRVDPQPSAMSSWLSSPALMAKHFPLLDRAWVFQERLLSPRILHFGPAELFWECNEHFVCECRDGLDPYPPECYPKVQHNRALIGEAGISRPEMWRNIVQAFSQLSITDPSDRLPALQGIANRMFRDEAPLKVLSGLWEGSLFQDLLWHSNGLHIKTVKTLHCRAPSWSWAKTNRGASYFLNAKSTICYGSVVSFTLREHPRDDRTIVDAASVQVSASVLPGRVTYESPSTAHFKAKFYFEPPFHSVCYYYGQTLKMFHLDWERSYADTPPFQSGTVAYCLFMATISSEGTKKDFCLVVKHAENGRMQFERIGCLVRWHSNPGRLLPGGDDEGPTFEEMFRNAERTTITLI